MTVLALVMAFAAVGFALAWFSAQETIGQLRRDIEWERKVSAAMTVQRNDASDELLQARKSFHRKMYGGNR